jgi:chemotaxis protein methyltransferase CheR
MIAMQATGNSSDGVPVGIPRRAPVAAASSDVAISPDLFTKYQTMIYREAGIWLAAHKTALLTGRLSRRLRLLGLSSMGEYYKLVTQPDQQHERAIMLDCITTNETHFFREPRHFEFLAHSVFPRLRQQAESGQRQKRIRIWSAGCSTGEEPYSLAMMLLKHFGEDGWDLEVLGSDISTRVLEKARSALFPIDKAKEIPKDYLHAYMLKGINDQEGLMKVAPEVHKLVRFSRVNLNADTYPMSADCDLVFCRNVLIYFDQSSKAKVVTGLLRHLSPTGLLFIGHSENLNSLMPGLKSIIPTVYSRLSPDGKTYHPSPGRHFDGNGTF